MKKILSLLFAITLIAASCGDDAADVVTAGQAPTPVPAQSSDEPVDDTPGAPSDSDAPADLQLPLGAGSYPIGTLDFTVTHPELGTVSYVISCLGDTATLTGDWSPNASDTLGDVAADKMCLRLADPDVQDRLVNGLGFDVMCTEIYGGPEEAIVTGELDGSPVNVELNRSDGCGIDGWDRLMVDLVPPAAQG